MLRQFRLAFALVGLFAASACGSRADQLVLPANVVTPVMDTGPVPADSTSTARGPGLMGSGN
jgi:hypothetical protein